MQSVNDRHILMLTQRFGLPEILARLLVMRDIAPDDIEAYLSPRLRDTLPDPLTLTDMDKAVKRIHTALIGQEKIAVFGDYDVDGATSSALLMRYMRALQKDVRVYIPDRVREGYGPTKSAFQHLYDEGIQLIITVDCGTMAHEALTHAAQLGVDVIVLDHHQTGTDMPIANALVNPRRPDDMSGLGHLAAVGVVFMLLVGLNRYLRTQNFFTENKKEPDLLALLDLVALGTICDVVPLQGVNRAFVLQGLKIMARKENIGLAALAHIARAQETLGTYEVGFQLGPRINAGGRVGESELGIRLLSSTDMDEAHALALRLDQYNLERQAIEADVLTQAQLMVETQIADKNSPPPVLLVASEGWHPGVVGIVASRLKDKYNRPSFVLAIDEARMIKGSARSVKGCDIGAIIARAVAQGIIQSGGGHAMAAGVSLTRDRMETFTTYLHDAIAPFISHEPHRLKIDATLNPSAATRDLYELVQQIGPFGAGNPEPRFALMHSRIIKADAVGAQGNHMRCIIASSNGGKGIKAMAFASVSEDVRAALRAQAGTCHIAGYLRADNWQGRRDVQFIIHDILPDLNA